MARAQENIDERNQRVAALLIGAMFGLALISVISILLLN
jgi:hypothetical protein